MLAGASTRAPAQVQLDHLRRDVPPLMREREREHRDLRVDPVGLRVLRKEQDAARRMAVAEPGERLDGRLLPLRGNPGEVRHDARPQVRPFGLLRGLAPQPVQRADDVADRDVLRAPLLGLHLGRAQCRSHSLPSRRDELVRGHRAPRPGRVVREGWPVALPGGDDRVHERPLLLDLVRAREQRLVAEHRVEDQPLVRLGQVGAEGAAVHEVHVHRCGSASPARAPWRRSRARCPRPAGRARPAGSGAAPRSPRPRTAGAARAGTGSRSSSRGAAAACRCAGRTACRPSASCRRRASRRRTSRSSSPARRLPPRGSPATSLPST